jgi:hypothetical protein
VSADWLELNPGQITGAGGQGADQGSGGLRSGLTSAAQTATGPTPPLWSTDNPLFWFGGLALIVFGGITISSVVDVGPLKGKLKI